LSIFKNKTMPRPPRKAFKTRRQAFQIGLQKEGIETIEHITPGKRVKVRENAKKLLRENDQKARMLAYAAVLVVIVATVFFSLIF
jgi:hypothetical protein